MIQTITMTPMNRIRTNIKVAIYVAYIFGLFVIVEVIDFLRNLTKQHAYKYTKPKNLQDSKAQDR